jgi:hypothetical protein
MRRYFALGGALLLSAVCALPQNPSVIPLIPAANWRLVSSQKLPLDAVQNYGGVPIVESEYGVKVLEERTYQLEGFRAQVLIESAQDPTAGYGLYTYYRTEAMAPEKGIQYTVRGPEQALMLRGRSFVRIQWKKDPALSDNDLRALMILIGGTKPTTAALASLPSPMPADGLVPGSEKYLIGPDVTGRVLPGFRADLIGFAQGAEAQLGIYSSNGKHATVLAISYPTPQMARVRFGAFTNLLGVNQDKGRDSLYGKRQGSYVFLVLNAENPSFAEKMMGRFNVQRQLSWDERYPGSRPFSLQLLELIISNIIIIMVVAGSGVFGGVLIVLSRRIAGKFFPDWAWGHPEEDRLIRLNLQ